MKRYYNGQVYYIKGPDDHKILKTVLVIVAVLVVIATGIGVAVHVRSDKNDDKKMITKEETSTREKAEDTISTSEEAKFTGQVTTADDITTEKVTTSTDKNTGRFDDTQDDIVTGEEDVYNSDLRHKSGLLHKEAQSWTAEQSCTSVKDFAKIFDEYILSGSTDKLSIHIDEITIEDLDDINEMLTQPFAFMAGTSYKDNANGGIDVDVRITYDDSYYVYRYIVYGIEIPTDNSRAEEIYTALCDMLQNQDISTKSDYEKELFYHDYITDLAEYDEAAVNSDVRNDAHSVYGLMVDHKCVCEGYARTMGLLLSISGIDNYYVSGTTTDSSSAGAGGHAWNIVSIDGKWYQLDATWDDPTGEHLTEFYHTYFNVSDEMMRKSRIWDESLYPACESMDANYFKVTGTYFDSYDQFMTYAENELDKNNGKGNVVAAVSNYDSVTYDIEKIHKKIYPQSYMTYNVDNISADYTIIILQY